MYRNVVCEIVEQPAKANTRFRYTCEGRTAGSILGLNSSQAKRTYPAIRILNYTGTAVVIVSCVSKDEPFRPHPYALVGKGCKKSVCTVEFTTHESAPTVIEFRNVGIQCCRKNDMQKLLTERESLKIDPFKTGFKHKNSYSEIDIFAVRLCFQVGLRPNQDEGDDKTKYRSIKPVVTNTIFDKKYRADLLIYDISDTTSPTDGGKKIMIFCDKISKNDINIRFYQTNESDSVVWEGWGAFKLRNIHHQHAIAFLTPPYVTKDIDNPVKVFLQLVRPSDGLRSEPLAFQYIPNVSNLNNLVKNKKRKIEESKDFCEYVQTFEEQQRKSFKMTINIDPMTGCKEVADKENAEPPAVSYESNFNIPVYSQSYHPQPQPNYHVQQFKQHTNYHLQSNGHAFNQQQANHFPSNRKPLGNNNVHQEPLNNHFLQQTQGSFQPYNQQNNFSQPSGHPQQLLTDWRQNDYPKQQPQVSSFHHQQQDHPHPAPYFQQMYSNSGYGGLEVPNYEPVSYYSNVEQAYNLSHANLNENCLNNLNSSINQEIHFEKNILEDVENMSDSFSSLILIN